MQSWLDLESRFKELREPLRHVRLDIQWGCEGEYFRLAGGSSSPITRQFETLAGVAGRFMERSLQKDTELGMALLAEPNPNIRWYRALKELSGEFQPDFPGEVRDEAGNFMGHIFCGHLHAVAEASANLCLRMYAEFPLREDRSFWRRLYDDYGKEIVIGTFIAITTAIVSIIVGIFFGGKS
jgi:hypothetical protein